MAAGPFGVLDDGARGLLEPADHPEQVGPMLAELEHDPFEEGSELFDDRWVFERKLDGLRLLLHRDGDSTALWTRNHERRDGHFPELVEALAELGPADVVLDGEVVAFEGGLTSFSRLQGRIGIADPDEARASGIAVYCYVFDVLHLAGHDTRRLGLRDRKRLLKHAVGFEDPLRFTPHRTGDGPARLAEACEAGWEGLIAKDATAAYRAGRSRSWRKLKCQASQELVVGGFTDPQGERTGLGALLVGYHDQPGDGRLVYAGKVGTGYDQQTLRSLRDRLDDLETDQPPFEDPPDGPGVHFVAPELVAEVGFTEWTHRGRLRHPRYLGLRDDKDPADVVREV